MLYPELRGREGLVGGSGHDPNPGQRSVGRWRASCRDAPWLTRFALHPPLPVEQVEACGAQTRILSSASRRYRDGGGALGQAVGASAMVRNAATGPSPNFA
ncbi:hypothetical protein [Micromonospora chersina]|uniref:hypothetical protein n=1 Tax=Micromonospora chersina TaxID=47854 RepID=UPI0036B2932C